MGRRLKKRGRPSRAERIARAGSMALVPYGYQHPSPSALEVRLKKHNALMEDLVRKGLDYTSIPNKMLATIVRDFQTAGIDVPTPALRAVSNTTYRMPQPKKRPAPITAGPLPDTRILPDAYEFAPPDARDNLIRRGFNPKTGRTSSSPLPYLGASQALPYAPVHRYTAGMSTRAAQSIAASNWLPPWMVEGDQPNQFVKTPREPVRAMSKGIGPSYDYITHTMNRTPSASVQAFNARQAQGLSMPYTGRIRTVDDRIMRGMGAGRDDDLELPVTRRRRIDNLNDALMDQRAAKPLPPLPPKKAAAIISAVAKDPSTRLSTSPPHSPPSPAVIIPSAAPIKKAAAKKAAAAAGPAAAAGQRTSKAPVKFTPSKSPLPSAQDIAAAVKDSPLFKARRRKLDMGK